MRHKYIRPALHVYDKIYFDLWTSSTSWSVLINCYNIVAPAHISNIDIIHRHIFLLRKKNQRFRKREGAGIKMSSSAILVLKRTTTFKKTQASSQYPVHWTLGDGLKGLNTQALYYLNACNRLKVKALNKQNNTKAVKSTLRGSWKMRPCGPIKQACQVGSKWLWATKLGKNCVVSKMYISFLIQFLLIF